MKYKYLKKRIYCMVIALAMAFLGTGMLSLAKQKNLQEEIAKEVFRFHVLANSDSARDQELKLLVKEKVIAYMEEALPKSESVRETKLWAISHLEEIAKAAQDTLREEGCVYPVSASVTECYFPDKTYGDITFPSGRYDALRIEIGEGKGQNWWCVLYPNLCFIDAIHAVVPEEGKRELREVLKEDAYELVTATSKFKIKWFFF